MIALTASIICGWVAHQRRRDGITYTVSLTKNKLVQKNFEHSFISFAEFIKHKRMKCGQATISSYLVIISACPLKKIDPHFYSAQIIKSKVISNTRGKNMVLQIADVNTNQKEVSLHHQIILRTHCTSLKYHSTHSFAQSHLC